MELARRCFHCGGDLAGKRASAVYCDDVCRLRARRRRRAGLPEDAYADGARAGRVSLRELRKRAEEERERRAQLALRLAMPR